VPYAASGALENSSGAQNGYPSREPPNQCRPWQARRPAQASDWKSHGATSPRPGHGRLEIYLTDPAQEPDMSKWVTQLAFRLAD